MLIFTIRKRWKEKEREPPQMGERRGRGDREKRRRRWRRNIEERL